MPQSPAPQLWQPLAIGSVRVDPPLCLAPMAGVSDEAFRIIAKDYGCGLVFTEMVSSRALCYGNRHTEEMLEFSDAVRPIAVQLFGSEPDVMAQAAARVEERWRPDLLDINMGCPAPKVVANGDGAALLKDPARAVAVAAAVVRAVHAPVTVKMRSGWDQSAPDTAVDLAQRLQDAGVAAITLHPRTRSQFYGGHSDWSLIRRVKERLQIPVIGNGDVATPEDALTMWQQTGCDGIMIGRGALGAPWIFREVQHFLRTGSLLPPVSAQERLSVALRHLRLAVAQKGERVAVPEMRKHLAWYLKGLPGAARIRQQINQIATYPDLEALLRSLLSDLA